MPKIDIQADFKTFLQQVKLRDEKNNAVSANVIIPEQYKQNSFAEMYQMAETLYRTYTKVLLDFQLNQGIRDRMQKELLSLKTEIDKIEEKLYGSIQQPLDILQSSFKGRKIPLGTDEVIETTEFDSRKILM